MDIYKLSRSWFDFAFENPDMIAPIHTAIYFFAIEHCNRLGWKEKFGFPTSMAMDAIGVKNYKTYIKALNELVEWGFITMVEKSKNQYSANIVALVKNTKATTKALDKASLKHISKQLPKQAQSTDSINIPIYNNTNLQNNVVVDSDPTKFQQPTTGVEFEFMTLANCRIIYTTKYQLQWETICMNNKISKEQLKDVLDEFDKWVGTKETHKIPKDYCEHFARWITKEHAQDFIKKLKTPKNERSQYAHFGF